MNTFWLKIAVFAVIVIGLIVLVKNFAKSVIEDVKNTKTFSEVVGEDDKRLRAEPEQLPKAKQARAERRTSGTERVAEPVTRQFKKLTEIENIDAERLFNVAIQGRKMGRLPGPGYKLMADSCRQIIEKYPGSIWAFKARRMLGDIPERFRQRYNITEEEINPDNEN